MKSYLQKHHRLVGGISALIACMVGLIYLVVVPENPSNTYWFQNSILSYGHSLCWFLLGAASAIWAIKKKNKWSVPLAYMALAVYVIFLGALVFTEIL